ncbi:MAG: hypothetical protein S0880_37190 [Actinomycetota bacterium]|nr:hypothetical protein [Actinomycetota bacterium]
MEPLAVTVPAAVGLIGAPADQLGGRVLGLALANYRAWAHLEPAEGITIRSDDDEPAWRSVQELSDEVDRYGHIGSQRLVTAAVRTVNRHARRLGASVSRQGFRLRYGSDIPRQVGLGGSTALIVAVQDVVCRHLGVEVDPLVRPTLALAAEADELGLVGAPRTSVIQVLGGVVAMDFEPDRTEAVDGLGHGRYDPVDPSGLPPLFVAHLAAAAAADDSARRELRTRWERADGSVAEIARRLSGLAAEARAAASWRDPGRLAALIDASADLAGTLTMPADLTLMMLEEARDLGIAATPVGSGAIVGAYEDDAAFDAVRSRLGELGAEVQRVEVAEPLHQLAVTGGPPVGDGPRPIHDR